MTRAYVYAAAALAIIVATLAATTAIYRAGYRAGAAHEQAAATAELDSARKQVAESESRANAAAVAAEQAYNEGMQHAQSVADRTIADLRSGNLQLRERWKTCSSRVPETAGPAAEPVATGDDRADSASRIVRAAAECDARVSAWQRFYSDVRSAVE